MRQAAVRNPNIERLYQIPHLNVTELLKPPMNALLSEYLLVKRKFAPYRFDEQVVLEDDQNTPANFASTYEVIDVLGWGRDDKSISAVIRNTVTWIRTFTSDSVRARITKIKPSSDTAWHRHVLTSAHESIRIYLHVPLETNDSVRFGVKSIRGKQPEIFWQHYRVGEAWIFNSNGMHTVENAGQSNRCHLNVAIRSDDPCFAAIVSRALEGYEGPLMEIT
jgi:hypothetical protein